jgi:hypothetical protein
VPSIASLSATCLGVERAIKLDRLEELVGESGDRRQRPFDVAAQFYGAQHALRNELLELEGADLDRALEANGFSNDASGPAERSQASDPCRRTRQPVPPS